MQNIDLICVGKLNAPYFAAGVAEYQKRLGAFCNFRIIELPEAAIADKNASDAQMNSTPFVRQYDILSNKWGVLLCQKEYQTNDIRRNSREWL